MKAYKKTSPIVLGILYMNVKHAGLGGSKTSCKEDGLIYDSCNICAGFRPLILSGNKNYLQGNITCHWQILSTQKQNKLCLFFSQYIKNPCLGTGHLLTMQDITSGITKLIIWE